MSLIFNRTSSPAYLHLPAQGSIYKVMGAFAAGLILASLFLYRPADTGKFMKGGSSAALAVGPLSNTDGSAGKSAFSGEGETAGDDEAAAGHKPNERKRAGNTSRSANGERIVTLSDGRRITIFGDGSSGSASRHNSEKASDRIPLGPFRLNAPNYPR